MEVGHLKTYKSLLEERKELESDPTVSKKLKQFENLIAETRFSVIAGDEFEALMRLNKLKQVFFELVADLDDFDVRSARNFRELVKLYIQEQENQAQEQGDQVA